MNRKLVNGLLLLSIATVGCGTFTSCKDTDEDFKTEVIQSQAELAKTILEYIDAHQCDCPPELIAELKKWLANPEYDPENENSKKYLDVATVLRAWLQELIGDDNYDWLTDYELVYDENGNPVKKFTNSLVVLGQDVAKLYKDLYGVGVDEDGNPLKDENGNPYGPENPAPDSILGRLGAEEAATTDIYKILNGDPTSTDAFAKKGLLQAMKDMMTDVATAEDNIKILQTLTNKLNDRINKFVTGILTQQTYNPLFGSINLPIGLQSNIVANYYGYTATEIVFPFDDVNEYNSDKSVLNNSAIQAALENLGYETESVKGYYMDNDDPENNLGIIYATLNPNNVFFGPNGVSLSLVNSKDEEAPVKLTPAKENDKVLTFGYQTRAAENNGFYRVPVYVEPENAEEMSIKIESGLKSSMKDLLNSPSKSDIVAVAKNLLSQMDGITPAYALKATWTAPDVNSTYDDATKKVTDNTVNKTYSVYSNYNIAATTIHPLGYEFLYGEGINRELPTFGHLTDKLHEFFNDIRKDVTFNLNLGIDVNKYNINLDLSKVTFNLDFDKLTVKIPQLPVYGHTHYKYKVINGEVVYEKDADGNLIVADGHKDNDDCVIGTTGATTIELTYTDGQVSGNEGALNGLINAINSAIESMMKDEENPNSFASIIKNEVTGKMNALIADLNTQLESINTDINGQVKDILNKIENQLAGKLNGAQKLVDKYNALAKKINHFLKNPNNYLQVMMAYETKADGLHQLSTSFNDPSIFTPNSGNAATLYCTSYTADLVVPSYKKYVACTRAWKNGAEAPAAAKAVNDASANFNKVFPGRGQMVGISGLQSKTKYEIIYTSLDYRGRTSTNVYYIYVK